MRYIRVDGEKVRSIAKDRGTNLKAIAVVMGMHYNSVYRIVNTGVTTLPTLAALCEALNCNPLDILVWDNDYPPPGGK